MGDNNQSLAERETILMTNEAADEWELYTQNPRLMRIFGKFSEEYPSLCRVKSCDDKFHSRTFTIEKSSITVRPKKPQTEEQKAARREIALRTGNLRKEPK